MTVGCLVGLLAAVFGIGWLVTPSVSGASSLVNTRLAAHGHTPMSTVPSPDRTGQALVATEDSRFYHDPGIDPIGVVRATAGAVDGHDTGGAGLDQQLAKLLYTPGRDNLAAQAEQAMLAIKINLHYSKPVQLRMYENSAYFGNGFYGLSAAARGYFERAPDQLSWAQASMLAGLVQAPSAYDPLHHLAAARARQHHVLSRLVATGTLTHAQARAVYHSPLHLADHPGGGTT